MLYAISIQKVTQKQKNKKNPLNIFSGFVVIKMILD
tara:strand:- start:118 stop:225 length:108 start_codon:yes stop_codon:yes gene_type:complete